MGRKRIGRRTNNRRNGTAGRGTGGARASVGGKRWRRGGGEWRRKGRGRMQRIRKERSPAPAYVMPSGHCQPAPAPFCLARGQGREEEEEEGEVVDGAKGQSCPRNPQSRENSDRSQGLISIFGRSFACSLFEHPTTKIPTTTTTTPGIAFENNIPRSRGLSFSPDLSRSKGLGTGEAQVSMAMILHPILPRYCLHQSSNGRHFDTIPFLFDGFF